MANLFETVDRIRVATMDYEELGEEEMLWVLKNVYEEAVAACDDVLENVPITDEQMWGDNEPEKGCRRD